MVGMGQGKKEKQKGEKAKFSSGLTVLEFGGIAIVLFHHVDILVAGHTCGWRKENGGGGVR